MTEAEVKEIARRVNFIISFLTGKWAMAYIDEAGRVYVNMFPGDG